MFKSIASLLFYSTDLDKTYEFYETLGFEPQKKDGMVIFFVNWFQVGFIDKAHSMFKDGFSADKGNGMFVHVKVEDVDSYYKFVTEKGIKPSSEPRDWEWGNREFVIKDPDGYRFVFFNKSK